VTQSIMAELARHYRRTHVNLLDLVDSLTDAQIAWAPNATTPSIGFHVWHLARWADYLHELIQGRGSQLWETEGLAARWDMATASLGYAQTGMSMDEQAAMALRMPGKELLLDYARRAFAAAQAAVARIGDQDYYTVYQTLHGENWHDGQIGPIISTWLTHDNRHLGMIECLAGVQGIQGSADS
jgi:hypothetical protein